MQMQQRHSIKIYGSGNSRKTVNFTTPEAKSLPLTLPQDWRWMHMIMFEICFTEERTQSWSQKKEKHYRFMTSRNGPVNVKIYLIIYVFCTLK